MDTENNLYEILLNALITGDVKKIVQAASEYLNCPVMLVDAKYNCLALSPDQKIGDPLWDDIHQFGAPTIEFVNKLNDEKMMSMGSSQKEPYMIDWGFLYDYPRIVVNILVNQNCIGYLTIITKTINEEIKEQARLISDTISLDLQRKSVESAYIPDYQTMFLVELFSGKITGRQQLKHWEKNLIRPYSGDFCILSACPKDSNRGIQYIEHMQMRINKYDAALNPIVSNNIIHFLISGLKNEKDLIRHITNIQKRLAGFNLIFGSSYRFEHLEDNSIYIKQADYALSICKCREKEHLNYIDCILANISNILKNNIPYESITHPAIEKIKDYDNKYRTDYLHTLQVYLKTMCNGAETVKELNIHRNTLPHRLEMLEEIGEIKLHDFDTCMHLLFIFQSYLKEE